MKRSRFYIFFALATLCAGRLMYASDVINKQVVNLVICNNCSEESLERAAIGNQLMRSLRDKQLVLCTKKLFDNLYYGWPSYAVTYLRGGVGEISLARDYICKEVTADYILCIPLSLLKISAEQGRAAIGLEKTIGEKIINLWFTEQDLRLGLLISALQNYDHKAFAQSENFVSLLMQGLKGVVFGPSKFSSIKCIGGTEGVIEALERLSLKKTFLREVKADKRDLACAYLPRMNVLLAGHGSYSGLYGRENFDSIAGISANSVDPKTSSPFEQFLRCLNNDYNVQSLSILSCCAGYNINKMSQNFENKTFFAQASYPILFTSGLFALAASIRPALSNKGRIEQFFEYLNHVESYRVKNQKTGTEEYSYSARKPEWKKAIDVFSKLFSDSGVDLLQHVTFVKFPNTSAIFLPELDSRIMTITPIKAVASQDELTVPEKALIVLLQAPYVQRSVVLQNTNLEKQKVANYKQDNALFIVPAIIGKQVGDVVNYCFEEIRCAGDISNLAAVFFNYTLTIKGWLAQSFSILIKKAYCGSAEYSDVLLMYNGLFSRQVMYKDSSGHINFIDLLKNGDFVKDFEMEAPEMEVSELEEFYNKMVNEIYQNAKQGVQETTQKIDTLNALFAKGAQSVQEVKKQQEFRAQKAKQEDPKSAAIPQVYSAPKAKQKSLQEKPLLNKLWSRQVA